MIEILKTPNNLLTIKKDGIYLLSAYDPIRDIKRFIDKIELKESEFVVLFGIGLGYLSSELSRRTDVYAFIPFEKERDFLNVVEIKRDNILDILEKEFIKGKKPRIVALESYKKAFPEEYSEFENLIIFYTRMAVENIKVTTFFGRVWFFNFVRNVFLGLKKNFGFIERIESKAEKDILICASGVSLNEYLDFIKSERDKFILMAVLSSVYTLVSNNIIPDIVLITDGGVANSFYIQNLPEDVLIFADIYSSSSFLSKLNNRVVFVNFLEEIYNPSFSLKDPSVSITAGKVAKQLTEGKVVYCGFDLAYSLNYGSHSFPNVFTLPYLKKFNRLSKVENYFFSFLKRDDLVLYDGRITNKQFLLVKQEIKDDFYYLTNEIGLNFMKKFDKFSLNTKHFKIEVSSLMNKKNEILKLLSQIEENEILEKLFLKELIKDFPLQIIYKKLKKLSYQIKKQLQH